MFNKRLISMVTDARRFICADVALQWVALLANIALFIGIGFFLQGLLEKSLTAAQIATLAIAALAALAVRFFCQAGAQRMGQKAANEAKSTVRQAVYAKLVDMGPSYRENVTSGEALQVSVEGVEHLESYFGSYLPQLFYAVLAPLTLFACVAPLSLPTAVTLLACVPLIPISIVAVQRIAKRVMGRYWGSYTDLGSFFLESIQGLGTLKIFQADEKRHEEMNKEAESFRRATMRLLVMQLNSITVMDLFAFCGAAAGIIMAMVQLADGAASFGAVFAIVFLSAEFFLPMRALGSFFHTAMSGMAAADKMFKILDAPSPRGGDRTIGKDTTIECRGVSYSYDGERMVLEDVDVTVPQGSFVGLTGESGSGKSTLAGILAGSLSNFRGRVEIGGVPLRDVSRESLRKTVTYVPFASHLFEGTVASNLRLAKPDASDPELWDVLQRCRLEGLVRSAGGLDAPVAAEGSNLSGGQRQRLAMARALLHDTPVYILDEATSNIDAESEAAIIELVKQLASTKTVIMITHRLAALKSADSICVLADGSVAECGPHDALCIAGGAYERLWNEQSRLEAYAHAPASDAERSAIAYDAFEEEALEGDDAPQAIEGARRSHLRVMASLLKLASPLLPVLFAAVVLGVLGFLAAIFLTVFAGYGLLDLAGQNAGMTWTAAAVAVAACGIMRGPLRYGEQLCNHYLAFRVLALVRDRLFAVMRRLAPAKLEGHDKGSLVSLMTSDVELLEVFFAHTVSPAVIALVVSTAMTVFIAFQSPVLAILAACAYLVMGVAVPWVSSRSSGTLGSKVRNGIAAMNSFVLDSLRGLPEILQFGRAQQRCRELEGKTAALTEIEDSLKKRTAFSMALTGTLVLAFDLAMLALATFLVMTGKLAFGPAALSVIALMSSFGPVIAVANLGTALQQTLASGNRVLDLLAEEPVVDEVDDGTRIDSFTGAKLQGVGFSYGGAQVLEDVDLAIEPGRIVRIAGKSGAGKSTLLKLMMRFWDPDSGQVNVSGNDVRDIDTRSLRNIEGFMTQETFLFDGTIRDNLLMAKPLATDEELRDALEKVALAEFVDRLPKGLDTPLGEVGDGLSGGERQRLGLARVMLHDAPLVLLDEPTSNLDSLNEAVVLRTLCENRGGKTIVLVSHRPSTASIADEVYDVQMEGRRS